MPGPRDPLLKVVLIAYNRLAGNSTGICGSGCAQPLLSTGADSSAEGAAGCDISSSISPSSGKESDRTSEASSARGRVAASAALRASSVVRCRSASSFARASSSSRSLRNLSCSACSLSVFPRLRAGHVPLLDVCAPSRAPPSPHALQLPCALSRCGPFLSSLCGASYSSLSGRELRFRRPWQRLRLFCPHRRRLLVSFLRHDGFLAVPGSQSDGWALGILWDGCG